MRNETPVYITGHQHPDTDSIASSIAYAFFKRAMGIKAIPCRLGDLNNETEYLLKRFGYEKPMLLKDARITLADLSLDEPVAITPDTTVRDAIRKMHEYERSSFAVVNPDGTLAGYVSKSDLANIGLGDTAAEIELLRQTAVKEIARTIDGTLIYDDEEAHYDGKTSIIALNENKVANYNAKDRIVIVGNDSTAQKQLIEKGAGMLIVVWANAIDDEVIETAKTYHCPIILSGHGAMNTSRYLFFAPPVRLIMTDDPITFRNSEFAEDAGAKMLKTRFRSYPVVDENRVLCGYVSRFHILNHKNKKIILVDHNEFSQSVRNVEKAQILEVIDHHRINDFATSQPVSFRNEIIGSTATIVATMFRENQIPIPSSLAGLLLGAVLSDTLVFQSPTTTRKDIDTANILAALADLDIDVFAREMFTASASSQKQSIYEMIVQDIKFYDISGVRTMISQTIVPSVETMRSREIEIQRDMNRLYEKKELDLLVVCFTSVLEDGSIFYAVGEKADKILDVYPDADGVPHSIQKGVFSRKTQIVPAVIEALE
ncbi:MAG: putative manganese-dependent inorganic diphosphatase [Solobacterium sp.]|nr:putative manganese-dependent inorganic diphosphatase [Solobacterium sp.]